MQEYQSITLLIGALVVALVLIALIVALGMRARSLSRELEALEATVRLTSQDRNETRKDRDNWKSTATALKADVEKWQEENAALIIDRNDYQKIASAFSDKSDERAKEIEQLKKSYNQLSADHELFSADRTTLAGMVKTLTGKLKEQGDAIDKLIDNRASNGFGQARDENGLFLSGKAGAITIPANALKAVDVLDVKTIVQKSRSIGFSVTPRPDDSHPGEQAKPTRDWSVPQAFPEGYIIPRSIEVEVVYETRSYSHSSFRVNGLKGITIEKSIFPDCEWEDGAQVSMRSHQLAPVNPTDHPEHPQFNPSK